MPHFSVEHVEAARDRFRTVLRERGQRQTSERFAILDEIYRTGEHLDADTLFTRLREQNVPVSRATVYNTLDLLVSCGLVARHQFGEAQARYERAYSYAQHDHLICTECGEIYEFCDPRLRDTETMIGDIYGFQVRHHALTLYGECGRMPCPNRESDRASGPVAV